MKQLPDLKIQCPWLEEINSQSLQQALKHSDYAFTRFFKGLGNFPKFKKKTARQSFTIPQNVAVENGKLLIPNFREGIEMVLHRPLKGRIKRATIIKSPTGKYFVSVLCETGEQPKPKARVQDLTTIGIDLGIASFLVTSKNEQIENPRFIRRSLSKLQFVQRRYSKYKGKRTRKKLARLHEKVGNQRKDFLHQTSTRLIRENQSIALEDLNVKGMLQNHCLAQAISDCSWSRFVIMLEYKAKWQGRNILKIGTFEPSSKTCSCCGYIKKELTLQEREWTCGRCGKVHLRDLNAAINTKNFALKRYGVWNGYLNSERAAGSGRSADFRSSRPLGNE
jgi:putative transposase